MTDHPITPPPDLVQQWFHEAQRNGDPDVVCWMQATAAKAAQWGADQQLAKDAEWLDQHALDAPHLKITPVGASLKEAMRPKPPTLKEQALCELVNAYNSDQINDSTYDTIRKALKALPND
jgi:hypothetical protein